MDINSYITHYGLVAIFIGCFVEGETVAMTGGIFAQRELLSLRYVMITAAMAVYCSDILFFFIGRYYKDSKWVKRTCQKPAFAKALNAVSKYQIWFAFTLRFMAGMRTVGLFVLAQSTLSMVKFAIIDAFSVVIWACAYTLIGYGISHVIIAHFHDTTLTEYIWALPLCIFAILGGFTLRRLLK